VSSTVFVSVFINIVTCHCSEGCNTGDGAFIACNPFDLNEIIVPAARGPVWGLWICSLSQSAFGVPLTEPSQVTVEQVENRHLLRMDFPDQIEASFQLVADCCCRCSPTIKALQKIKYNTRENERVEASWCLVASCNRFGGENHSQLPLLLGHYSSGCWHGGLETVNSINFTIASQSLAERRALG